MFLKRERPETDDFEIKEYLVVKEKYLVNISLFQEITNTLTKMFLCSEYYFFVWTARSPKF